MPTVKEIYEYVDSKAPFRYQMDFDNAGFLVGHADREVSRVLIALDITFEAIEEAIVQGCQLIISHHPVIWGQIQKVTDQDTTGRKLLLLAENQIAAICAHTNLDAVEGGVNTALANAMGLENPQVLEYCGVDENGNAYGVGRYGSVPETLRSLDKIAEKAKQALGIPGIRVMNAGTPVEKVAVGGGACGSMLSDVVKAGCDTFLTSDLKHDIYLEAKSLGINLLDAGHYSTEAVVCPVLKQWLESEYPGLTVMISKNQSEVFEYL